MSTLGRLQQHRSSCRQQTAQRGPRARARDALPAFAIALLVTLLLLLAARAQAQSPGAGTTYPEDAVKAVFLYRFAGYVQWPMSNDEPSRFVVAVMGADDVAARLHSLLPDHPIHGLPADVRRIGGLEGLGDAQMLYVGPDYGGDLGALLARLRGRPVLVVTDREGALEAGSMVNFLLQGGHVRFEVSMVAARQARLLISSDLLAVAQRVKTGDRRPLPLCAPLRHQAAACDHRVATR